MLETARSFGDYLIVCIHTDECVLKYKNKIPVFSLEDRIALLESMSCVDEVAVLDQLNPLPFIRTSLRSYRPLIMVHGDDWLPEGWDDCAKLEGVTIKQIPLLHGHGINNPDAYTRYSTSNLIQKIKDSK